MPRTERGRATRKRSDWNPADGRSPIRRGERWDARFRNTLSKPPSKGKDRVGPATGIARSNLEPGKSVFNRTKPAFDRGVFKQPPTKRGVHVHFTDFYVDLASKKISLKGQLAALSKATGATVPAVLEDASCGDFVKINGKIDQSHSALLAKARTSLNLIAATIANAPPYLGRLFAAVIMDHKLLRPMLRVGRLCHLILVRHNGRLWPHIRRGWFGDGYPKRWNQPASSYLDVRMVGKATNSSDLTWGQAAGRMADETFANLGTKRKRKQPLEPDQRECPQCFYETPVLGFFWLWLVAYLEPDKSHRYIPSRVYWKREPDGHKLGRIVSLDDLRVNLPRLARYLRECFRQVAKTVKRPAPLTDRDRMILKHWPLIQGMCRGKGTKVAIPKSERADAEQACVARLLKTYDEWKERGAFTSYAAQAIEWALQDFMNALRRQRPVDRSINLNDPVDTSDDDEDDKPKQPERPDNDENEFAGNESHRGEAPTRC
jgi:hypothetical protein